MEPHHLRDYQHEGKEAVLEEWKTHNSTLLVQATGLGKTVLAAEIIRQCQPWRTLFLAHRAELIYQAKEKIERFTGLECGIEMASERSDRGLFGRTPVVISSVQTQYSNNNARVFKPDEFGLLIVDEAHHYVAPAFRRIIDHYRQNPNLKVLGLTATPNRTDEAALGEIFESCAHKYEIIDGVEDGYLVDIKQLFVPVNGLDYSHVRTTAGDLNLKDLAAVMEAEQTIQGMIQPIMEIGWGAPQYSLSKLPVAEWGPFLQANGKARKAIVFCASVDQAKMFAHIMNRAIPDCAAFVSESTPKPERKYLLHEFASGERLNTICNVGILGEGFDCPPVEIIIQARATESLVVYTQQIGRATRSLPGVIDGLSSVEARREAIANSAKPFCTIVDFVGNSGRHKLISSADVLGGESSEDVIERARQKAQVSGRPENISALLAKSLEEIQAEKAEQERREEARKARLVAKSRYGMVSVSPFEATGLTPRRTRGWETNKELTDGQQKVWKLIIGYNPNAFKDYTYAQKKQLIDEQFRRWDECLCTVAQAMQLKAMGKDTNIGEIEAARMLGRPQCSAQQAVELRARGLDPFDYSYRSAREILARPSPENAPVPALVSAKPAGIATSEPATPGQKKRLSNYHYNAALLTKVEASRLIVRLVRNKWKPLAFSDQDHPKNWKPSGNGTPPS